MFLSIVVSVTRFDLGSLPWDGLVTGRLFFPWVQPINQTFVWLLVLLLILLVGPSSSLFFCFLTFQIVIAAHVTLRIDLVTLTFHPRGLTFELSGLISLAVNHYFYFKYVNIEWYGFTDGSALCLWISAIRFSAFLVGWTSSFSFGCTHGPTWYILLTEWLEK